jgi:hypothetical protein
MYRKSLLLFPDDVVSAPTEGGKDGELTSPEGEQAHDAAVTEADEPVGELTEEQSITENIANSEQQAANSDPTDSKTVEFRAKYSVQLTWP